MAGLQNITAKKKTDSILLREVKCVCMSRCTLFWSPIHTHNESQFKKSESQWIRAQETLKVVVTWQGRQAGRNTC